MINLQETFMKYNDVYPLSFNDVELKYSYCRELHVFMFLNKLVPFGHTLIGAAEHDQIWLYVDLEELAKVATDDDIRTLSICGVFYDEDIESLSMYV